MSSLNKGRHAKQKVGMWGVLGMGQSSRLDVPSPSPNLILETEDLSNQGGKRTLEINPHGGTCVCTFAKDLASALKGMKSLVLFTDQDNLFGKNLGQ